MQETKPKQSLLKFIKKTKVNDIRFITRLPINKINDSEWMGKPPGSCMIGGFEQEEATPEGGTATFTITIVCKPPGYISHIKGTRYDGYRLVGRVNPNTGDYEEAAKPYDIYHSAGFSEYDFGEYRGEFYND
jgi:hypothetical protein